MSTTDDDVTRDWLGEPGDASPPDPVRAARANTAPPLPKRFYKEAGLAAVEGGHRLVLDGRGPTRRADARSRCRARRWAGRSPQNGRRRAR